MLTVRNYHVNCNYRPNGTATSLSPKCYSANVPLDVCTTADFEMKYFFLTKALLAFWVIPNWFSRFCSQNGYLNSKLMLRWDGHFKYKFRIIHIKIALLCRASVIVSIFAAKRRFFPSFWTWSQPPRNLVPDALRAYPLHKRTDWIRPTVLRILGNAETFLQHGPYGNHFLQLAI